jgi:predicted Fe-Mo cluster-binding NifX family protein
MMKLAIPVWQSRISPVFDTAENLMVLEVEDGQEISRMEYPLSDLTPFRRAKQLAELHVDVLLCGAISRPLRDLMNKSGIKVIPWISGELQEIIPRYLDGQPLDGEFLMPGCTRRNRRGCRRGRQRTSYPEDIV